MHNLFHNETTILLSLYFFVDRMKNYKMNWILICSIAGAIIIVITAILQANKEK